MLIDAWRRAMPWVKDAACAVEPYSSWQWIIEANSVRDCPPTAAARVAVCAVCPVRRECLTHALTETGFTPEGVWGSTLRVERTKAWTAKMGQLHPDPNFRMPGSWRADTDLVPASMSGERVTDVDRHRIAGEIADEFEATLSARLAALERRADEHRAKLAARAAEREAERAQRAPALADGGGLLPRDSADNARMGNIGIVQETISPKDLLVRLEDFERRYELPSVRFVEAFRNGELRETSDFHRWARTYAAWKSSTGEEL